MVQHPVHPHPEAWEDLPETPNKTAKGKQVELEREDPHKTVHHCMIDHYCYFPAVTVTLFRPHCCSWTNIMAIGICIVFDDPEGDKNNII